VWQLLCSKVLVEPAGRCWWWNQPLFSRISTKLQQQITSLGQAENEAEAWTPNALCFMGCSENNGRSSWQVIF